MAKWPSNRPTFRQWRFLQRVGLKVPPTRKAASRLIGYILNGNDTLGADEGMRISIVREFENMWVSKTVVHPQRGRGTVKYLLALSKDAVRTRRRFQKARGHDTFVQPLAGFVEYETGERQPEMFCNLSLPEPRE